MVISGAAAFIAYWSYSASVTQAEISAKTLEFARAESANNAKDTKAAIDVARRSASATETQAGHLKDALNIAREDQKINREAMLADQAGEITFTAELLLNEKPGNFPVVKFVAKNVGKSIIRRAYIQANIALLKTGEVGSIFKKMPIGQTQTIEFTGSEEQFVHLPYEINKVGVYELFRQRLALVAAIKVSWKDAHDPRLKIRSKCYFWTGSLDRPGAGACPNLEER